MSEPSESESTLFMIKFFRKIRLHLLSKSKFIQYFFYAVGEILLVVIGILIALQIDNNNEVRKRKAFEQEIITLIDQNLEQDSISLSGELFKANQGMRLTDSVLSYAANKKYTDSVNFWMGKIISFERFKSQSSSFEVLKAKGIETISDNELQLALIAYYDEYLFKIQESLNDVEQSFKADWIPMIKQEFVDFKWMNYCVPVDPKRFFEKPSTVVLFKIYKDNRAGEVRYVDSTLNKIAEIRKQIRKVKKK